MWCFLFPCCLEYLHVFFSFLHSYLCLKSDTPKFQNINPTNDVVQIWLGVLFIIATFATYLQMWNETEEEWMQLI